MKNARAKLSTNTTTGKQVPLPVTMCVCEHGSPFCEDFRLWLEGLFAQIPSVRVYYWVFQLSGRTDFVELEMWLRLQPFSLCLTRTHVHYIALILMKKEGVFFDELNFHGSADVLREALKCRIWSLRNFDRRET